VLIFHFTRDNQRAEGAKLVVFFFSPSVRDLQILQKSCGEDYSLILHPRAPPGPRQLTHQMRPRRSAEEMAVGLPTNISSKNPTSPVANEPLNKDPGFTAGTPRLTTKNPTRRSGICGNSFFALKGRRWWIPEVGEAREKTWKLGLLRSYARAVHASTKNYKSGSQHGKLSPEWRDVWSKPRHTRTGSSKLTGQTWGAAHGTSKRPGWYEKRPAKTLRLLCVFSPNPRRQRRLQQKVKELGGNSPLPETPRGSFPSSFPRTRSG